MNRMNQMQCCNCTTIVKREMIVRETVTYQTKSDQMSKSMAKPKAPVVKSPALNSTVINNNVSRNNNPAAMISIRQAPTINRAPSPANMTRIVPIGTMNNSSAVPFNKTMSFGLSPMRGKNDSTIADLSFSMPNKQDMSKMQTRLSPQPAKMMSLNSTSKLHAESSNSLMSLEASGFVPSYNSTKIFKK